MKKIAGLLLVALSLLVQPVWAADKSDSAPSMWEKLKKKIYMLTPQKKLDATTAVGGVRGAPSDANDVYWKGEAAHAVDADELSAFKKAIELVEAGETKQAQAAFAEFIKNHPESTLRKDADQALVLLQSGKQ